jgi:hypothetical protein
MEFQPLGAFGIDPPDAQTKAEFPATRPVATRNSICEPLTTSK